MPQTGGRTVFEGAGERFAREALPFPPLPERFAARLQPFGAHVFTTRELDHGPYATGVLVAEVLISSFGGSGWGWARTGKGESSWHEDQDVVRGVTQAVAALFAGTG